MSDERLEALTVALNRELYAESAGLPFDEAAMQAHAADLTAEYESRLTLEGTTEPGRDMALDGLADAQSAGWDLRLAEAMDAAITSTQARTAGGERANWRNWKHVEQQIGDRESRRALFEAFVEQSKALAPVIEGRFEARRRLYGAHGTTPLEVFARREGLRLQAIREMALRLGDACREPFFALLSDLGGRVFGPGPVGPAELHALYLNQMYAPFAATFAGRDAVADVQAMLGGLGFSTAEFQMDFEERPLKYPGAFCFPVRTPGDVRVSVRPASPHHLADMLFHEFGHAVHFAGIDPALSFAARYWIHSGTHETYSTLFEMLLGLPEFLAEGLGLPEEVAGQLVVFDRFKFLLTAAWQSAAGLTAFEAWAERLAWPEVERRFAAYALRFTGVEFPAGFARLHAFVNDVEPYPLGYVIAAVRSANWLEELQAEFGPRWWARREAGDSIRALIRPGGAVRFREGWTDPSAFLERWVYQEIETADKRR